jgi:hypothetical protein
MVRKLRFQPAGAMYHMMSWSKRCENILLNDVGRLTGEPSFPQDAGEARQQFEGRLEARRLQKGAEEERKDIETRLSSSMGRSANACLQQWMRQPMAMASAQAQIRL